MEGQAEEQEPGDELAEGRRGHGAVRPLVGELPGQLGVQVGLWPEALRC